MAAMTLHRHKGKDWPSDEECAFCEVESLRSRLLDAKEQVAALESREVCTVAHDNVETCGYCQRDELQAELALTVARAENAERALEEADERHSRYVKAVGELSWMAARSQDAQRYRWLVGQNDPIIWDYLGGMDDDQIDEAIDKWIADDAHLSREEQP